MVFFSSAILLRSSWVERLANTAADFPSDPGPDVKSISPLWLRYSSIIWECKILYIVMHNTMVLLL